MKYALRTGLCGILIVISQINAASFESAGGDAIVTSDSSAAYYNPAGLTTLKNPQISTWDLIAITAITFEGSATNFDIPLTQTGSTYSNTLINLPAFFYGMPLTPSISFGIGFLNPFYGLIEYSDSSMLRYSGTSALITTYDFTPALAIKLTNSLSIGAGLDAEYLDSYENFMLPSTPPGGADLASYNKGTNWGYGAHAGLLWHPVKDSYFGLVYHSQVHVNAHGDSTLKLPDGSQSVSDQFTYAITFPPSSVFSVYEILSEKLSLLATTELTQWSAVTDLFLQNVVLTPGQTTAFHQPFYYHDTWRFALTPEYQLNSKWAFKAIAAYDQDPSNPEFQPANVPSADAYVVGAGAHWQMSKTLGFSLSYTHYFYENAHLNEAGISNNQIGTLKEVGDCIGIALNWDIV